MLFSPVRSEVLTQSLCRSTYSSADLSAPEASWTSILTDWDRVWDSSLLLRGLTFLLWHLFFCKDPTLKLNEWFQERSSVVRVSSPSDSLPFPLIWLCSLLYFLGFIKKSEILCDPVQKYSMQQVQLFVSATSIWCSSPHAFGMWFGLQSLWSAQLTARVTVHVCQPNNPSVILCERQLQYQIVILINSSRKISQPSWCGRKSGGLLILNCHLPDDVQTKSILYGNSTDSCKDWGVLVQ